MACYIPQYSQQVLGFQEIVQNWIDACQTEFAVQELQNIRFDYSQSEREQRFKFAKEAQKWASTKVTPPFSAIFDLRELLLFASKDGCLTALEIKKVGSTLAAFGRIQALLESRFDELPLLNNFAAGLLLQAAFAARITRSFDDEGNFTDEASPELKIRRERVRTLSKEARLIIDRKMKEYEPQGFLQSTVFTIRRDRYVLPVKTEFQGRVDGIVHDASQTEQTVFIEPRALWEMGNRITVAIASVKEEEKRLLLEMTVDILDQREEILASLDKIGVLEAYYVQGCFSDRCNAEIIERSNHNFVLHALRHPLLLEEEKLLQEENAASDINKESKVVAQSIALAEHKALIISGANAGGKTVALKNCGLAAIFSQAALLFPCAEQSFLPEFHAILASIGDEQSLGEHLSTFSGHLKKLGQILKDATECLREGSVLIILDEICAGTAPEQGAALAQSIISKLLDMGAHVLVSTHYESLKTLALAGENKDIYRNASVGFNPINGEPTFEIILDSFASSNAFEAARRMGIPADIISAAEDISDPNGRHLQQVLASLDAIKESYQAQKLELLSEKQELFNKEQKLREKLEKVRAREHKIRTGETKQLLGDIIKARKVVKKQIQKAQNKGEMGIKELNKLNEELSRQATREEQALQNKNSTQMTHLKVVTDPKVGQMVRVKSMPEHTLKILEIKGHKVTVGKGIMKMQVKKDEIFTATGGTLAASKASSRNHKHKKNIKLEIKSSVSPKTSYNTLDIRGQRVEDAFELADAFLDKMMAQNNSEAYIVHGHGTGVLKAAIREFLSTSKYVLSWQAADRHDGGDGTTVCTLS